MLKKTTYKKQQKVETSKTEIKQMTKTSKVNEIDPYNIPQISNGEIVQEKEEVKPVKTYHIGTPEFRKASDTMINSFNLLKELILKPEELNEETVDILDEIKSNILSELYDIYHTENNKRSFKLLSDTLGYETDICEDLIGYCEDQDPIWYKNMDIIVEAIDNNFKELTDIVNGKEEDK